jgi:periplasmic copper chaperone A
MMPPRSPSSPKAGPGARPRHASILLLCALLGGLLVAGTTVSAADGKLALRGPWFRLVMPSLPAAGYFILSNPTDAVHTLVGAASPACGMLMLHRSVNQNGQERMVMVQGVPVPAHSNVTFAPGGYHLMCMSPAKTMTPGHSVPVTLRFADGNILSANFPVRNATGR